MTHILLTQGNVQKNQVISIKNMALLALIALPWMPIFTKLGIEICVSVIAFTFLWQSYRFEHWQWMKDPFFILCIIAWLWLGLVVTPLALSPSDSLSSALTWIRFPMLYVACRYWLLKGTRARKVLAISLLFLLSFVAVDVLWQYHTGVSLTGHERTINLRLTGPFTTPKAGLVLGKFFLPTFIFAGCFLMASVGSYWIRGVL